MNIMVIDDSADSRFLMGHDLESAGHVVTEACDRDDAIHKIEHGSSPNLVFMDLCMPGMSIENFVERSREVAGRDIPMVITSGSPDAETVADRLEAYYLPPLFSREDIQKTAQIFEVAQ